MSKYRSKITEYNGVKYHSKAEADRAHLHDLEIRVKRVKFWIGQPTIRLGVAENVYKPDFLVVRWDGSIRFEDVKGPETAKFKRDKKLWRRFGPAPLDIVKRGKITETITPEGWTEP